MAALRVAFAGLAHSHPFSDASSIEACRAQGAEVEFVGVYDADEEKRAEFAERFACGETISLEELATRNPDLVIATPRPSETARVARVLLRETSAVVFFNKVIAATDAHLTEWQEAVSSAPERVGTSSVLRFAPAIAALAERTFDVEVWSIRVLAQHDIDMFLVPDRMWQDDPTVGGGTLVTVGLHAWEMIGRILPDAVLDSGVTGWIQRSPQARTQSEQTAQMSGTLRLLDGRRVPYSVLVAGVPGPEVYAIDVLTSSGMQSVRLSSFSPEESLGFKELAVALLSKAEQGVVVAPWSTARPIVTNTIRAAQALRGSTRTEMSQRNVY